MQNVNLLLRYVSEVEVPDRVELWPQIFHGVRQSNLRRRQRRAAFAVGFLLLIASLPLAMAGASDLLHRSGLFLVPSLDSGPTFTDRTRRHRGRLSAAGGGGAGDRSRRPAGRVCPW